LVIAGNEMRSLVERLDRLERAFGTLREREKELDFAQLNQLSREERRERIVQLSVKIAERRGITQPPGERIEDAVARTLKAEPPRGSTVLIADV
jgi:hypothetical protein